MDPGRKKLLWPSASEFPTALSFFYLSINCSVCAWLIDFLWRASANLSCWLHTKKNNILARKRSKQIAQRDIHPKETRKEGSAGLIGKTSARHRTVNCQKAAGRIWPQTKLRNLPKHNSPAPGGKTAIAESELCGWQWDPGRPGGTRAAVCMEARPII